ncbi:MAG: hypothetical protein Q9191_007941 [Dirinaria sp. TL-2023a]
MSDMQAEHSELSQESPQEENPLTSPTQQQSDTTNTEEASATSPVADCLRQAAQSSTHNTSTKDRKPSILRSAQAAFPTAGTQLTSAPCSISLDERLKEAARNAKLNQGNINLNEARSSSQREPSDSFKTRTPAAAHKATAPETSKPFKAKPDPVLSPVVQHLLHYQRGRHNQPLSEVSKSSEASPGSKSDDDDDDDPIFKWTPSIPSKDVKMINAKAICSLLTENMDENASDWVFFTVNGSVLGYADNTSIALSREIGAMVGGAWRCHDHAILNDDASSTETAKTFCKTIEVIPHEEKAAGLRALVVELEGMVAAVHIVKQRLLVAAMLPKEKFEQGEAASVSSGEESAPKPPSKQQILLWRAEGMAEELRGDLADFELPKDFY